MSLDCDRAGESSSRVYWFLPFFLCDLFLSFRVGGGGGAGSAADGVSGLGMEDGGGWAGSATGGAAFAFSPGDRGFAAGSLGGTGAAVVRVAAERAANGISSEGSESASIQVLADVSSPSLRALIGNRSYRHLGAVPLCPSACWRLPLADARAPPSRRVCLRGWYAMPPVRSATWTLHRCACWITLRPSPSRRRPCQAAVKQTQSPYAGVSGSLASCGRCHLARDCSLSRLGPYSSLSLRPRLARLVLPSPISGAASSLLASIARRSASASSYPASRLFMVDLRFPDWVTEEFRALRPSFSLGDFVPSFPSDGGRDAVRE